MIDQVREVSNLTKYWIMKDEKLNQSFELTSFDDVYSKLEKLSYEEISLLKGWLINGHRMRVNNKLIGLGFLTKN